MNCNHYNTRDLGFIWAEGKLVECLDCSKVYIIPDPAAVEAELQEMIESA